MRFSDKFRDAFLSRNHENSFCNDATAPDESPPAYSATPLRPDLVKRTPKSNKLIFSSKVKDSDDTDFSFLSSFDIVILIDDSRCMEGRCWRETAKALETIAPICTQHDSDGIDIHFLNNSAKYSRVTTFKEVKEIFESVRPIGATPTGSRLCTILNPYLDKLEETGEENVKPLDIIVITDGQATDDVESAILDAASRLDRLNAVAWQVGIQFFQVGDDPDAKKMLQNLDDKLPEKGVRDMVDTMSWTDGTGLNGQGILKCVLGAVVRRRDNVEGSSVRATH